MRPVTNGFISDFCAGKAGALDIFETQQKTNPTRDSDEENMAFGSGQEAIREKSENAEKQNA